MKKKELKKFATLIFIISFISLIFAFIFSKFEIFAIILFLIFFITLIACIIMKLITQIDKEKKETKWIFEGSAGWLLFWLIVSPPIGYIWLIFDMRKKEIKRKENKK